MRSLPAWCLVGHQCTLELSLVWNELLCTRAQTQNTTTWNATSVMPTLHSIHTTPPSLLFSAAHYQHLCLGKVSFICMNGYYHLSRFKFSIKKNVHEWHEWHHFTNTLLFYSHNEWYQRIHPTTSTTANATAAAATTTAITTTTATTTIATTTMQITPLH